MLASTNFVSCNSSFPIKSIPNSAISAPHPNPKTPFPRTSLPLRFCRPYSYRTIISHFRKKGPVQICRSSANDQDSQDPVLEKEASLKGELGGNGSGGPVGDWTTSFLLFLLWAGLMYYIFNLTPNQTPTRDVYFLQKLLNLKGDDGFQMNEVLVSLWYIMGLWPLLYSMMLLPTGRRIQISIRT